jgi:hypothetical protein
MEINCVGGFETSNVLRGHSTHHQGQHKLNNMKRVYERIYL